MANAHTPRFIRLSKVLEMTGMGKTYIYSCIAKGTFPKQIHIGGRSVVWNEGDIVNWMRERMQGENV